MSLLDLSDGEMTYSKLPMSMSGGLLGTINTSVV